MGPELNKPHFNLSNADIEKSSPQQQKFGLERQTNPLVPEYKLPSFEARPITPPKFMRDSLDVSDIEGTKAKRDPYLDYKTRPSMNLEDIEGSKSKVLHKSRSRSPEGYDHLNYSDVNKDGLFVSKRQTNPLAPEYLIRDEENTL